MKSKHLAKLVGAIVMAMAAVAMVAPVAQAEETPATGYGQFEGCPSTKEKPLVSSCLRSVVKSGHFNMGNKEVPISTPIVLRGGVDEELGNFVYTPKGGLLPSKQIVPGGVVGLTGLNWLIEFLNVEQLKLYAVTELAGTPEFHNINSITLPIKVHLINTALGNKCYVGSNAAPIVLNLTTGTTAPPKPNTPITGKVPKFEFDFEKEILHVNGGTYVDNSFAAPGVNGCTLTLLGILPIPLNTIVNLASGLPSAAGTNETVQDIDSEIVEEALVYP